MTNFMTVTETQAYTPEQIERRARSVSINAIREMRVAYGRDAGPWTDDDSRRVNAIFELLHLARFEEVTPQNESFPLVSPQQAPENKLLDDIERQLAKLGVAVGAEEEEEMPRAIKISSARSK